MTDRISISDQPFDQHSINSENKPKASNCKVYDFDSLPKRYHFQFIDDKNVKKTSVCSEAIRA